MQILTNDEILSLLFKFSQGFDETNTGKSHFQEWLLDDRIWTERSIIPTTAPALNDGESLGVVTKRVDLVLTQVPGNPKAYYHPYIKDAIHYKYGDGSYDWVVKNDNDTELEKGAYRWIKAPNSQVLYFYDAVPPNMPPKITFYQYSGSKDEFGGVGAGSGDADEKFRGNYDPNSGTLPQNGSGTNGAIKKGDYWRISQAGLLTDLEPEPNLSKGDLLFAAVNEPIEVDGYFAVSVNIDATNLLKVDSPIIPTQDEKDAMTASTDPSTTNPFMTRTAVLEEVSKLGEFVGDHDASTGQLPTQGSGPSASIVKGDYWRVSVGGTITGLSPEEKLEPGDVIHAKVDDATNVSEFFSTQANADLESYAKIDDSRFPTTDEKAALSGANAPSAANPVATANDLAGAGGTTQKEIKSTIDLGGITKTDVFPIGTKHDDIFEKMIDVYLAPTLDSLSVSLTPAAAEYEVGQELGINSATYAASNDSDGNTPQNLLLNGVGFNFAPTGATTPATPGSTVIKITDTSESWSITGEDKDSNPIPPAQFTRNWRFRHCFGASATILTPLSTPAEVKAVLDALQDNILLPNKGRTVTCGAYNDLAGNYTYIAYAAKYGDINNIIQDGALPVLGAFTKLTEINYDNPHGITETYSIYKSNADKAFADGTELVIS